LRILVDADACPVKDEVYRVAERHGVPVLLVANQWMRVPGKEWIEIEVVPGDFDAADDRIVERLEPGDLVISADIPLAARCVEKGARVLGHRGRELTEDTIGEAVATRDLLTQLRESGDVTGGPPPFGKKDRSKFLQSLEEMLRALKK
jgi:hypothetical protein